MFIGILLKDIISPRNDLSTCYDYGGNMYFFTNKNGWENVLQEVEENVKLYLKKEESSILKKYDGIGLGFVDGDLIIVYRK